MSNDTCYYHPNSNAVAKCELCGKKICLDCKRIYREEIRHGAGKYRSYNILRYEYCPVCYHQSVINSTKGGILNLIFTIPFAIIFIVVILGIMSSFSSDTFPGFNSFFGLIFTIVPILMIVGVVYKGFVSNTQKVEESKAKLDQFLKETGTKSTMDFENPSYYRNSHKKLKGTLYCNQCGNKLEHGDEYCNNCGDSTRDEGLKL